MLNKRGQVWIETVLYTLIGISLIGLVLAFVTPRINESKDRSAVEQSITSLNQLDEKINAVLQAPGNVRVVELGLRRGELYINGTGEEILWVISDISKPYSYPGINVSLGRTEIISYQGPKTSKTELRIRYSGQVNLTYNGVDKVPKFTSATVPYKFSINHVNLENGYPVVDIEEISGG